MAHIVTYDEIDLSSPRTVSVSATSTTVSTSRLNLPRRTSFFLVPLTAGVTVTVTKGDGAAVANAGIVLIQNQAYLESDSEGFLCWQGAIQAIASGNGSVAVVEVFERSNNGN